MVRVAVWWSARLGSGAEGVAGVECDARRGRYGGAGCRAEGAGCGGSAATSGWCAIDAARCRAPARATQHTSRHTDTNTRLQNERPSPVAYFYFQYPVHTKP